MDFKLPAHEKALLRLVIKRIVKVLNIKDVNSTEMDLVACHKYDTKLDFVAMLTCAESDLAHDVHGISKNLSRRTGKLKNHFVPRLILRGTKDEALRTALCEMLDSISEKPYAPGVYLVSGLALNDIQEALGNPRDFDQTDT